MVDRDLPILSPSIGRRAGACQPRRDILRKPGTLLKQEQLARIHSIMSTMEQVKAAETRMNRAREDLRQYTERPEGADANINLYRHLADALKQATDEYVRLVAELGR